MCCIFGTKEKLLVPKILDHNKIILLSYFSCASYLPPITSSQTKPLTKIPRKV